MNIEEIRDDLAAFADDDGDFELDQAGDLLIHRGGTEISARIEIDTDGVYVVQVDDTQMSYRDFVTRRLGQLDVLASRLLEKRPGVSGFIDARANTDGADGDRIESSALEALDSQCADAVGFRSRVCFITADAGQGKTALLRQYQAQNATNFLEGSSPFVFWHVDLQGRQLLRLSEALMGDLGDLRVAGLWMPAIVRLIRHRSLVLAIDGFDELAAEQGGSDALGSLATLVQQMKGHGVVLAASRRAFFDTGDYLRRAGMFGRMVAEPCEFNQVTLQDWTSKDALAYLQEIQFEGRKISNPTETYAEIVTALGGSSDHPMVTKPFLLSHVARGLLTYDVTPGEFVKPADDPISGVASVVDAFVGREVAEKWIYRDTGEPYLTREQHIRFLADVAEEMYRAGKDRLQLDLVETLAAMRLEEWRIDPDRQRQVMEMVKMHALLKPPSEIEAQTRSFDHPEFRDYFIAIALKHHIEDLAVGESTAGATNYLSIAQLSDSVARYVRSQISGEVDDLLKAAVELSEAADKQVRSTFLQVNAGTLIPALIDELVPEDHLQLAGRVVYTSLVFESTKLRNVSFDGVTFLNVSFRGINWADVEIANSELGELSLHDDVIVDRVAIRDCEIDGVRRYIDGLEIERAYAPTRVRQILSEAGFIFDAGTPEPVSGHSDSSEVAIARRFLQAFTRSNLLTEDVIERRFGEDRPWVVDSLIPIFESKGVIVEKEWRGSGKGRIWALNCPLEMILRGEDSDGDQLSDLWDDLRKLSTT